MPNSGHDDTNIGTVVVEDGYLQTACQEAEERIHELRGVGNSELNFFDSNLSVKSLSRWGR